MRNDRVIRSLLLSIGMSVSLCTIAQGQSPDEATRQLWDTAFSAPKPTSTRRTPVNRRPTGRGYRNTTPNIPTAGVAGDTVVGVTVWRLRRSTPADSGERLIVQEGAEAGDWLPERIGGATKLAEGDHLRITIEAARTGYLYVIDREQYADGTLGEPYMIFPTTRTLGGNNEVKVGKVIEIPAQDDAPPYFTLRRSKAEQVAEIMSVLVTPKPLDGFQVTDKAQKLSEAQVAEWEKSWSTQVGALELENGAGKTWTKEEKSAGADPAKVLTRDGPAPQTIYYRPTAKPNEPMLVNVNLRYRAGTRKMTR